MEKQLRTSSYTKYSYIETRVRLREVIKQTNNSKSSIYFRNNWRWNSDKQPKIAKQLPHVL